MSSSKKYKEIFKLKDMLEKAEIPFDFVDWSHALGCFKPFIKEEKYQICYPDNSPYRLASVVEGFGTYGEADDKLELMGLLTDEEAESDCVVGYLTANDVFERIYINFYGRGTNKWI